MLITTVVGQCFHDSQSRQTVIWGHETRGTRNQESLCWRGPAAIYPIDRREKLNHE
jgi:hypothetical protein